ncbi:hypothetical protein QAD02_009492 [Eretmocerus hayati]|uniref:Uncharacterized protein n=1 Tax=Eretmocerus hayati TaxID=131215 RepID=A0ACC2N9V7_9HYME|nr:hypothetical protein QAD02_009492 [Eretmocerus hayati]
MKLLYLLFLVVLYISISEAVANFLDDIKDETDDVEIWVQGASGEARNWAKGAVESTKYWAEDAAKQGGAWAKNAAEKTQHWIKDAIQTIEENSQDGPISL